MEMFKAGLGYKKYLKIWTSHGPRKIRLFNPSSENGKCMSQLLTYQDIAPPIVTSRAREALIREAGKKFIVVVVEL